MTVFNPNRTDIVRSTTIWAHRFDARGHRLEEVQVNVNRVKDQVYVYIKGKGPAKHLVMNLRQWRQLESAVKEEKL